MNQLFRALQTTSQPPE